MQSVCHRSFAHLGLTASPQLRIIQCIAANTLGRISKNQHMRDDNVMVAAPPSGGLAKHRSRFPLPGPPKLCLPMTDSLRRFSATAEWSVQGESLSLRSLRVVLPWHLEFRDQERIPCMRFQFTSPFLSFPNFQTHCDQQRPTCSISPTHTISTGPKSFSKHQIFSLSFSKPADYLLYRRILSSYIPPPARRLRVVFHIPPYPQMHTQYMQADHASPTVPPNP